MRRHFLRVLERAASEVGGNAGGVDKGSQRLSERAMTRHTLLFAASIMQLLDCPFGTVWPDILDRWIPSAHGSGTVL